MNAYYKCTKCFYSIIVKIAANFRNANFDLFTIFSKNKSNRYLSS